VEGRDRVGLLVAGEDAWASESDAVVAGFRALNLCVAKVIFSIQRMGNRPEALQREAWPVLLVWLLQEARQGVKISGEQK
jgi:hypothetical protein